MYAPTRRASGVGFAWRMLKAPQLDRARNRGFRHSLKTTPSRTSAGAERSGASGWVCSWSSWSWRCSDGQVPDPRSPRPKRPAIRLEVSHPSVSRPGLAIRLSIVVSREGGFEQPVRLIVLREYIEALDFNAIYPDAAAQIADDGYVIWEFDPPRGDSLTVDFDGRHEPGAEGVIHGDVAVLDQGQTGGRGGILDVGAALMGVVLRSASRLRLHIPAAQTCWEEGALRAVAFRVDPPRCHRRHRATGDHPGRLLSGRGQSSPPGRWPC